MEKSLGPWRGEDECLCQWGGGSFLTTNQLIFHQAIEKVEELPVALRVRLAVLALYGKPPHLSHLIVLSLIVLSTCALQ